MISIKYNHHQLQTTISYSQEKYTSGECYDTITPYKLPYQKITYTIFKEIRTLAPHQGQNHETPAKIQLVKWIRPQFGVTQRGLYSYNVVSLVEVLSSRAQALHIHQLVWHLKIYESRITKNIYRFFFKNSWMMWEKKRFVQFYNK